jgi:hypothetical protein
MQECAEQGKNAGCGERVRDCECGLSGCSEIDVIESMICRWASWWMSTGINACIEVISRYSLKVYRIAFLSHARFIYVPYSRRTVDGKW